MSDKKVRVDIFALRDDGVIEGELLGPIRPQTPRLKPGGKYLVEAVVRTLGIGHTFSQGTADSNEIWVELIATSGGRVIGHSGGIGPDDTVDPYAHFINIYMLDRDGNRIDRRNAQDIFVPLYNKQIPPGAGQVVHFALELPSGEKGPITLEAKVNYRKFDRTYLNYIFGKGQGPKLPVVVMVRDEVRLPVEGGPPAANDPSPIEPAWQRLNDYGIGLLLEGATKGGQKGELKQAEEIFRKVAALEVADGWVNLARVYQREGRIPDALAALEKAARHKQPAAPWVINWLTGQINVSNGMLEHATENFQSVLATRIPDRKLDFSLDYRVINDLGATYYARARSVMPVSSPERIDLLQKAIATYRRTLAIDSENMTAHYQLGQAFGDAAWRDRKSPALPPESGAGGTDGAHAVDPDGIVKLAASVADRKQPASDRRSLALRLARQVIQFMDGPPPRYQSRMEPLYEIVEVLGPAWDAETDPTVRAALARALEMTHKRLHERLKPDETAEGQAFARRGRTTSPPIRMLSRSSFTHSIAQARPASTRRRRPSPRPRRPRSPRAKPQLKSPHRPRRQKRRKKNEAQSNASLDPRAGVRRSTPLGLRLRSAAAHTNRRGGRRAGPARGDQGRHVADRQVCRDHGRGRHQIPPPQRSAR